MGKTHADFCPRICPLVGPHIAQGILRLLRPVLQSTDYSESSSSAGSPTDIAAWLWALALGLSPVMGSLAGTRLTWLRQTRLEMPMGALLNALVFEKSTRIQISHNIEALAPNRSQKHKQSGKKGTNKGGGRAGQQSLTSLIATDSMLASTACGNSHRFPTALFNVLLDGIYLGSSADWNQERPLRRCRFSPAHYPLVCHTVRKLPVSAAPDVPGRRGRIQKHLRIPAGHPPSPLLVAGEAMGNPDSGVTCEGAQTHLESCNNVAAGV